MPQEDFPLGDLESGVINTASISEQRLLEDGANAARRVIELERQALTDQLTGLPNRQGWLQEVHKAMEGQEPLAIAFIDLDRFKELNDQQGHAAGDDALKRFAQHLKGVFRTHEDTEDNQVHSHHDAVAYEKVPRSIPGRYGGDEFKLMVQLNSRADRNTDMSPKERLAIIQKRWSESMTQFLNDNPDLKAAGLDASIGFAIWQPGDDLSDVLKQADDAMYRDKRAKKAV